ncbi:hypothetical protein FHS89_000805 [Rubricella aquisinus]|uniref:Sulfotransferase family protein n=1 Tax=Rubricella aquisinus TaxID=2028108 RepID=A0A840WI54_9RHOB|nr:hypothetical protein [Rubricella aquisinus]MBB5514799.1 hypothetical protein [Rubricella aquisinus]
MIAYPGLYFLDVPKTGTTRIRDILDFALGPPVDLAPHRPLPRQPDRGYLRLLSVRAPLPLYLSLFRYGCDGRGRLYHRLVAAGQGALYTPDQDGFAHWLAWMMEPRHADHIGLGYGAGVIARQIGFASHMTLSLAIPGARGVLARARSQFDLTARLSRRRLRPDGLIRNSHLEADLIAFLSCHADRLPLQHSIAQISEFAQRERRPNASRGGADITTQALPDTLKVRVRQRDWPLYDLFGSGEHLPQIDTAARAQIVPMGGEERLRRRAPLVPEPL